MRLYSHLLLLLFIPTTASIWIGDEYWATVAKDGRLADERRTTADLLRYDAIINRRLEDAYIAFWVVNDELGHHESFGQAWIAEDGRICARFVGRWNNKEEFCGGFRVLARHHLTRVNPFYFVKSKDLDPPRAVSYLGTGIAKITAWQKNFAFLGNVDLKEQSAYGIEYDSSLIRISRAKDRRFFDEFVEVLVMHPQYDSWDHWRSHFMPSERTSHSYEPVEGQESSEEKEENNKEY
ncbi:hypothetical protein L596_026417 [Steinernema carpocapsae]|uniref:Uncharacterized protein n=1 Tax=Steinernema carpocapsae TaxID=34508 RepID=A0A4U5M1C7_STECR|nr:hypothetical protein L596_026417 [Steinernema carpocapsae]